MTCKLSEAQVHIQHLWKQVQCPTRARGTSLIHYALTQVLQYDLLVGADGAGSAVRKAMAEIMPPGFSRQRTADARYAMVALPPVEPGTKTHSTFERHDFKVAASMHCQLDIQQSSRFASAHLARTALYPAGHSMMKRKGLVTYRGAMLH